MVVWERAACSKDFRDRKSLEGDVGDEEAKDPGGRGTGRPLYLAVESARSLPHKTETQKTGGSSLQRTRASDWRLMGDGPTKGRWALQSKGLFFRRVEFSWVPRGELVFT